jgi:GT2 family glycosyltransferase
MTKLSIVLITRNQAWNVRRLLESVLRETADVPREIILVDSASTDETVELACAYPIDVLQLHSDQRLTAAAGRYVGQMRTTGGLLLFLDGDMELCRDWLAAAMNRLDQSPEVAVVTGAVVNVFPNGETEVCGALPSPEAQRQVRSCGGAGLFRRSVLREVGTFNPYLYSEEEPELCLRIRRAGYRLVQLGHTIANHYSPSDDKLSTLIARWNRNLYVGFGQVIRYQFMNKVVWTYVRERGFVMVPAITLVAGLGSLAALLLGRGGWWLTSWCLLLASFLAYDALRKFSFRRTLASLVNRSLALAGTVRGLMLRPVAPQEYQVRLRLVRSAAEQVPFSGTSSSATSEAVPPKVVA